MDNGRHEAAAAEKTCSTCGTAKPLDEFSFDGRRKDGRQARCRKCVGEYQKRYRQENRKRYLQLRRAEYQRDMPRQKAYVQVNKDRIRDQNRARVAALSGERLEAAKAVHRAASEAYRLKNRHACNERIRAWKKANPDKASEGVNRRRAWRHGNGTPDKFTRTEIGERDGWACGICSLHVDKTLRFPDQMSPSLDHILPLSHGGEHSRANSRIAHWICNVRRGADRTNATRRAA